MLNLPHLESNVTLRCQNSCVACNHMVVPYRYAAGGPPTATPEQIEHDMRHLGRVVHADFWGALGGEPTLNRQLVDIFAVVRASGIADKLELFTHGQTLQTAERMHGSGFWKAFDILVVTVYPGKYTEESLAWISSKCKDSGVEFVLKNEDTHPNFQTLLDKRPSDQTLTLEKYRSCWFRTISRTVDFGYFFTCCTSPHIPHLLQGRPFGTDGLLVEDVTEAQVRAYLDQPTPLGACTLCSGRITATAAAIPWAEERDLTRWKRLSSGETLES